MYSSAGSGCTAVQPDFDPVVELIRPIPTTGFLKVAKTAHSDLSDSLILWFSEKLHAVVLTVKLTGVCIIIFCYTGQSVTSQLRQARPRGPSRPLYLPPLRVLYI